MASVEQASLLNLCALGLGTLLPDIDHPQSFLGKKNKLVSKVTNKTFGHRGATHSILALGFLFIIFSLIQTKYLTSAAKYLGFWLILGYFLHLLEDAFSKDAVWWFWPLKKRKQKNKFLYYKTGSLGEMLVFGLMVCLLLLEFKALWAGNLTNLIDNHWLIKLQKAFLALQSLF